MKVTFRVFKKIDGGWEEELIAQEERKFNLFKREEKIRDNAYYLLAKFSGDLVRADMNKRTILFT